MSITLCMIARDEARFLPACLASVAPLVDEIVVVDTGSTDDTVRLAEDAGARVVSFPWCDDFAAARNAALPHATSDYLLILDADERLTAAGCALIRRATEAGEADGWLLPLYNADRVDAPIEAVVSGDARKEGVTYQLRVLRRTPDLRWEGIIHETPRTWMERPGRVLGTMEAPVVHYGYAAEVVAERAKITRNERLLRMQCAQDRDNPDPRIYLAKTLISDERPQEAWPVLLEAWDLVRKGPPEDRCRAPVVMLATDLLPAAFTKPVEIGARYANEVLGWGVSHPNVAFFAGACLERRAQETGRGLDEARLAYERGIRHTGPPTVAFIPGIREWRLPLRLGLVLCQQGEHVHAEDWLRRAAGAYPGHGPIVIAWAEATCGAGDPATALHMLEPWMGAPDAVDAWWVAAWAMSQLGDLEGAQQVLSRAVSLGAPKERHRMRLVAMVGAA